jgi:PLP dependent protein
MIAENIKRVNRTISNISTTTGNNPSDITMVLVSKTVSPEHIREAYDAGIRDFGESKVQELLDKKNMLPNDIRWHFIGHVQTNKVKYLMEIDNLVLIHSLDSIHLAGELEKQALKAGKTVNVLLQVNTSGEQSKGGFSLADSEPAIKDIIAMTSLTIKGLMTMAPFVDTPAVIRESFRKLWCLRDDMQRIFSVIDFKYLSMGMSSDYAIALEEGSNMIRIGTAIFGER